MSRDDTEIPASKPPHAVKCRHQSEPLAPLRQFDPGAGPTSLVDRPCWGLWRFRLRNGGLAALTCDEGGILLDGGKPQAMSLWQASGLAATLDQGGVGVIVGAAPGVVGLTVEGCRDPSGRIGEVAQRLLAGIPSYAEISPSGTGITVIATIARPDACAPFRRDGFRAYRCGEVIPVTGWHVPGTPSDVLPVEAGLFSQLREFLS